MEESRRYCFISRFFWVSREMLWKEL